LDAKQLSYVVVAREKESNEWELRGERAARGSRRLKRINRNGKGFIVLCRHADMSPCIFYLFRQFAGRFLEFMERFVRRDIRLVELALGSRSSFSTRPM